MEQLVFVALYLTGAPRTVNVPRRRWLGVESICRQGHATVEAVCKSLRQGGFWTEATVLEDASLIAWAQAKSKSALTPFSAGYPSRWLVTLGSKAPPALWAQSISCIATDFRADLSRHRPTFRRWFEDGSGTSSNQAEHIGSHAPSQQSCLENPRTARYIGVVGERLVSPKDLDFAFRVGETLAASEYSLVSGGAMGCDSAALNGFTISKFQRGHLRHVNDYLVVHPNRSPIGCVPPLLLFPFGLERHLDDDGQLCQTVHYDQLESGQLDGRPMASLRDQLDEIGTGFQETSSAFHTVGTIVASSLCAPHEAFSTSAAMERNRLIYAASEATLVVRARHREGGSWHGAISALRDRLCPVFIQEDPSSLAHRTLISLGAIPMRDPEDLVEQVQHAGRHSGVQKTLF